MARRTHLAPFLESPRPWLVLARNAIPAVGNAFFFWTSEQVFLQLWFEGAISLGAMLAFQVTVFASRDETLLSGFPGSPTSSNARRAVTVLLWLVFWALFGIPYWFALLILGAYTGGPAGLLGVASSISVALLTVLAANLVEEWTRGYDRLTNSEIRLEFDWQFHMHLARITVLILAAFFLRLGVLVPLLLGLSYVEIYPMRALRFLGGDATLDRANQDRSRD